MKNTWVSLVVVAVVFGAGGFYAGMQYGKGAATTAAVPSGSQNRGGAGQGQGQGRAGRGFGNRGGDVVVGEVLAKDATSITVKLPEGGSKIVFVSSTTEMSKFSPATLKDLTAGMTVTARGSANADGSLTAQQVQIRPAGSRFPGSGAQPRQGQ